MRLGSVWKTVWKYKKMVLLMLLAAVGLSLIIGLPLMYLWNWLMPDIFGVREITYWQALGLLILAKVLLGGMGGSSSSGGGSGPKGHKREVCHQAAESIDTRATDDRRGSDYDRYWQEEGKAAYQRWLERIREDEKGQQSGD